MTHIFEVTDEEYQAITEAAKARGTTPGALFTQFVESLRGSLTQPRYYQMEDWFRHLEDFEEGEENVEGGGNANP